MIHVDQILVGGLIMSVLLSAFIVVSMKRNPRVWMQDYPADIQALVPPKTPQEKQESWIVGIMFLAVMVSVPLVSVIAARANDGDMSFLAAFVHVFGISMIFNLVDLLILDWGMFCTWTPAWLVIPGTEGAPGYKDYRFHVRGGVIGTVIAAVFAGVVALGIALL